MVTVPALLGWGLLLASLPRKWQSQWVLRPTSGPDSLHHGHFLFKPCSVLHREFTQNLWLPCSQTKILRESGFKNKSLLTRITFLVHHWPAHIRMLHLFLINCKASSEKSPFKMILFLPLCLFFFLLFLPFHRPPRFICTHFSCSDKMVKGLEHASLYQIGLMEMRTLLLAM